MPISSGRWPASESEVRIGQQCGPGQRRDLAIELAVAGCGLATELGTKRDKARGLHADRMFESNLRSLAGYFRAVGDDVEVHEFEAGRRVVNTGPVEFPTLFLNVLQFLDRLV